VRWQAQSNFYAPYISCSSGEKIVKIGEYLPKLPQIKQGYCFFRSPCIWWVYQHGGTWN